MRSEPFKPEATQGEKKSKQLNAWEKGGVAKKISLILPDDGMAAFGYGVGTRVEVALGDIWQGDWAAVLAVDENWYTGFAFLAYAGLYLRSARTDLPPRYFPLDHLVVGGRVVKAHGQRIIQAGVTLPSHGVDRIRFRFRL